MYRLALALIIAVWSFASHGVEMAPDAFGVKLDLLSIDIAFARGQNPGRRASLYTFNAGLVLTPAPDDSRNLFVPGGGLPRAGWGERKPEVERLESNGFRFDSGGGRPSLAPLLSLGSAERKVNLKLRRHSLFLQYRQDFH